MNRVAHQINITNDLPDCNIFSLTRATNLWLVENTLGVDRRQTSILPFVFTPIYQPVAQPTPTTCGPVPTRTAWASNRSHLPLHAEPMIYRAQPFVLFRLTVWHIKVRLNFVFLVFLGLCLVAFTRISGTLYRRQVGNTAFTRPVRERCPAVELHS
jgi:hypothetical protein